MGQQLNRTETGRALRLDRKKDPRLFDVVERLAPGFLVGHVLVDCPEQVADLYTVLIDGGRILRFELPRTPNPEPQEVEGFSVEDFRQLIGQGKFQLLLDQAIQDFRSAHADVR